jgi:hypothetical protein
VSECPTPWKTPFVDEQAARVEAARIKHDRRGPGGTVYPCACGRWHLTRGTSLGAKIHAALHRSDQ